MYHILIHQGLFQNLQRAGAGERLMRTDPAQQGEAARKAIVRARELGDRASAALAGAEAQPALGVSAGTSGIGT